MANTAELFTATGRRKTAVVRVNLNPGNGAATVNGKPFDEYFVTHDQRMEALKPLLLTENQKKFDVQLRAEGGGLSGQAGAASLALARALILFNSELRGVLKSNGLLTRDSRSRERKKPGRPGARKRYQFSKR
ncbi:MAG: 30S ribosomal protein S9 [Candidatus Methylacidiphilales bacterium]